MCAMREESDPGDVVDMDAWLLQRLTALEAAIEGKQWGSAKAEIHDMRTELEARLYREHLKRDPTFREHVRRVKERVASGKSDRVPVDAFLEWAEGIQPAR